MATISGTNYIKELDPTPSNLVDGVEAYCVERTLYDSVTLAAAAKGDVVMFGVKVPKGAKVLCSSKLKFAALGGSSALAVGYVGTPAGLAASTATTSAGTFDLTGGSAARIAAAANVMVTVSGSGAATGLVELELHYALY